MTRNPEVIPRSRWDRVVKRIEMLTTLIFTAVRDFAARRADRFEVKPWYYPRWHDNERPRFSLCAGEYGLGA
jgi:hypothetical protein